MIVFGRRVFFHILRERPGLIEELFLAKKCDKNTFKEINSSGLKITKLNERQAQSLARGGNHQGFLMRVRDFEFAPLAELKNEGFIVILHELSDVGNVGAIIRTAYALGVGGLVISGVNFNEQALAGLVRASSGAAMELKIARLARGGEGGEKGEILGLINELGQADFIVLASAAGGQDIREVMRGLGETRQDQAGTRPKIALILGGEGRGLSAKIIKKSEACVGVRMRAFDSLNVSAAFAILADRIIND